VLTERKPEPDTILIIGGEYGNFASPWKFDEELIIVLEDSTNGLPEWAESG